MLKNNLGQPQATHVLLSELAQSIFSTSAPLPIERMQEGVSTEVYRICHAGEVFYLRILPEVEASFAPEVYVHTLLQACGAHVPKVVYFEHLHPVLQRSVMITTEIPGHAIGHGAHDYDVRPIIRAAGQELAGVNAIAVAGFGWVLRDQPSVDRLQAEYATYEEWVQKHVAESFAVLGQRNVLSATDVATVGLVMAEATKLFGDEPSVLAHGDFDVTHIYQHSGQYTGLIDFGEIRGANRFYDLGHFQVENAELLPDLLAGYTEISPLPSDAMRRILAMSVLIAVRRLGRRIARSGDIYGPDLAAIARALRAWQPVGAVVTPTAIYSFPK